MKRYLIWGIILSVWSSICLAGTAAGNYIINNNSSYEMNRVDMQSNQMNQWNFTKTISANQSITTPIEFEWLWFTTHSAQDDSGTVSYQINCPSGKQIIKINAVVERRLPMIYSDYGAYFPIQSSGANCVKTELSTDYILLPDIDNIILTVVNSN
jgi:hypothetical protein